MEEAYLNKLSKKIHKDNVERGFYDTDRQTGTLLMLIVSELSEALEADRKGGNHDYEHSIPENIPDTNSPEFHSWFKENIKDTFNDEIADTFIRLFDLCGHFGIDIQKHIELKLAYNKTRGYKHGKQY